MKAKRKIFPLMIISIMIISQFTACGSITEKDLEVKIGEKFIIENSQKEIRQFPFLYEFDGKLVLSYSQHVDANLDYDTVDGYKISNDGGMTWSNRYEGKYSFFTSLTKLANGKLYGIHYEYIEDSGNNETKFNYGTSDDGITWENARTTVLFNDKNNKSIDAGKFSFHRSILLDKDGSLIASMYGKFKGDSRFRSIIVKSKDDGKTWGFVSTIAYDPEIGTDEGYSEPVLSRMKNGNIICVMRVQMFNEYVLSKAVPLYYTVSKDEGLSWSKTAMIPVEKNAYAFSVDPDLCLTQDGMLILSLGRPGCRILISPDGNGKKWIGPYDVETGKTSGYTGIRQVGENKYLIVGDEGANWSHPGEYVIWGRFITIAKK